jgi:Domain of unknown function (DUF4082)
MIGSRKTILNAKTNQPYSIFTDQFPIFPNQTDGVSYEMGLKFQSTVSGWITGVRHYKTSSETGTHIGNLWSSSGLLLASVTFANESAIGWQRQLLLTPLKINANTTYTVSVNCNQFFPQTINGLINSINKQSLSTVSDGQNGFFNTVPGSFPDTSFSSSNYFRDIIFIDA